MDTAAIKPRCCMHINEMQTWKAHRIVVDADDDFDESSFTASDQSEPKRLLPELANSNREGRGEILEGPEAKNKAVVRELYEAINRRDVARVHRLLAPDLEWWFHGPPERQHLRRLLTGEEEEGDIVTFQPGPQEVAAFGSIVLAEGCGPGAVVWIHAWTVGPGGVITQVREYFNTSLTVTRLGGDSAPAPTDGSAGSTQCCLPVWQSRLHRRAPKSLPGLVLAI
uniref:Wound-induced protein 1 n=1 Tax=Musa acuminata subsp. malaccensis TaxID=214687 RepID=A0A804JNK5_MUSAM